MPKSHLMNAYLVDDEQVNIETLKYMLQKHCPSINVVGESNDYTDAVLEIQKQKVDILFLDIQIGEGKSGFNIVDALKNYRGAIVFVTAFEEYAVKAFQYGAAHYIMKPIDPIELVVAVNRIIESKELKSAAPAAPGSMDQKIPFSSKKSIEMVPVDEIMYIQGQGSYSKVTMKEDQTITIPKNLKHVEQKLSMHPQFIRVHKSFVVNQKYISAYVHPSFIELSNKKLIPVSSTYKEMVTKIFR